VIDFFNSGYPQNKQITYAGMLWLLAAQLVIMLPLSFYLPIWLIPILMISAGWRIRVMQGHISQPGKLAKTIISALGIGALMLSGITPVSLDMMASLLMLGFAYKALEMEQRRDGMVVILTGYMLIGVLFLYSQSILTALYGVFSMVILTATMIAIQHPKSTTILSSFKLSAVMLFLCLPFMLTLFVFAPRFSPLWHFSFSSNQAKTGISDSMTPGDIANLSQSDELAFRVTFKGERPAQRDLYWRGLVLNHFDGETWTQIAGDTDSDQIRTLLKTNKFAIEKRLTQVGKPIDYDIVFEQSAQPWLFTLTPVIKMKGEAILGNDYRVMAKKDVNEPILLEFSSYLQAQRDINLSFEQRISALQLPEIGNGKSQALANEIMARSSSNLDYVNRVLNRYRQEEFYYTLRPPILGDEAVDDFLLETKRGFCAHYASSFVFMMRAVGIPARVIVGYQGGEWNDKGNYLAVHQFDAHSWTEVWLKNKGWIRVDPTTMVAPDRIEKNLETAMSNEGSFLEKQFLSSVKYSWLDGIRKTVDSGQYAWRKFVLSYDKEAQSNFIKQVFGNTSTLTIALVVGIILVSIILLWFVALGLVRRKPKEAPVHRIYRRFCQNMAKHGLERKPSQPAVEFAQLASDTFPEMSSKIEAFTQQYTQMCYIPSGDAEEKTGLLALKKLLKEIRFPV